ncbi:hypothetical protein AAFF_G00167720 [Aldrovandia affinis]|uniref:Uncharacterized protein n=1 Tax=Aldrovandia affinis TaxID=143900 RepID=A0AAD7RLS4_9TELE|nr:hypothetical protein AAFF_G00167720 [Aldrovandia affinis]
MQSGRQTVRLIGQGQNVLPRDTADNCFASGSNENHLCALNPTSVSWPERYGVLQAGVILTHNCARNQRKTQGVSRRRGRRLGNTNIPNSAVEAENDKVKLAVKVKGFPCFLNSSRWGVEGELWNSGGKERKIWPEASTFTLACCPD